MMALDLQMRPMQLDDLVAVMLIEERIYEFPWSQRNFSDSLAAGYDAWCLWREQQLVGYIVMMTVVDECHLLNLSVQADLQGCGFGRYLLQWGLQRVEQAGMEGMLLEVRPSNLAARALYEKAGFCSIGVRKNYYPARQGREDALVLFRRFKTEGQSS